MFDTVSIHGLSPPEWHSCSIEETLWRKTLPWMSPAQKRQLHELMPWKVLDCKCIRKQPSHWTFVSFFQDVLLKKLEPGAAGLCLEQCHGIHRLVASLVLGGSLVYLFNFFLLSSNASGTNLFSKKNKNNPVLSISFHRCFHFQAEALDGAESYSALL